MNSRTETRPNYPPLDLNLWKNIYKGDPRLAGIGFCQAPPDGPGEIIEDYRGAHPAEVIYYFWDGTVEGYHYHEDGKLKGKWSETWLDQVGDPNYWKRVNFSYGSDPGFLHHKDPRRH